MAGIARGDEFFVAGSRGLVLLAVRILRYDTAYILSADLKQASNIGILELHLVEFDYLVFLSGCLQRHHPVKGSSESMNRMQFIKL